MHLSAYTWSSWSHLSYRYCIYIYAYGCAYMCFHYILEYPRCRVGCGQSGYGLWYCWELRVLFGFCPKGFLTKCTLCIACVCVYVHPSYTGHGAWYHLYKPHVDLHGLMPITFNLVQRGWDRGSIKGRFEVYLYIWDENCWSSFSTIVFCSRDSVSSSHRLDRAKVEPVSLFKTNLNRCNVNVNLLLLSRGLLGNSAASGQ